MKLLPRLSSKQKSAFGRIFAILAVENQGGQLTDFFKVLVLRYDVALQLLPIDWRGPISLFLVLAIAGAIWHALQKSGIWLFLIIFLVPALIPTLRGVGVGLVHLMKALLERASL